MSPAQIQDRLRKILVGHVVQDVVLNVSADEPVGLIIRTELGESVRITGDESPQNDVRLRLYVEQLIGEPLA